MYINNGYTGNSYYLGIIQRSDSEYVRLYDTEGKYKEQTSGRDLEYDSPDRTVYMGWDNSNYFQGYVKEMIIYDRVLSDEEIESVRYYLVSKWGDEEYIGERSSLKVREKVINLNIRTKMKKIKMIIILYNI